jgi:mannan endo-1,4-beta-mannosidase
MSRDVVSRQGRMVLLVALATAAAAVAFVASQGAFSRTGHAAARASLPARPASYLGVYEAGPPRVYQPVANFARAAGRQPNLVGYYSGWAEPFAKSFAERVRGHGAVPIVQIDPTYAMIAAIGEGRYDAYLRAYADSVRAFAHPVVIGFGHEMNAPWYSWGYGHVPARVYVAAWRHIVTLFRSEGADNVTWLWTINVDGPGTGPIATWWPGPAFVTWVGIDGYYVRPSDTFAAVFGATIQLLRTFTSRPLLLSETAVGPIAGFVKIDNLFAGMRRYRMLGLVWFDFHQHHGIYHQDWRIEDNPEAEAAFRRSVSALTLAKP